MNRRNLVIALAVATVHVALASCPLPAGAITELDLQNSRDPVTIKNQLRMARRLGAQTLKGLRDEAGTSGPIAPETVRAAKDTYALIRSAKQGIEKARSVQKYEDPVLALTLKKVDEAWNLARISASKSTWSIQRDEFLGEAIPTLTRAMQLVDQALVLMP